MEDKIIQADFASNNRRLQTLEKSSGDFADQLISLNKQLISLETRVDNIETCLKEIADIFQKIQEIAKNAQKKQ